jgi:hypothetical protein
MIVGSREEKNQKLEAVAGRISAGAASAPGTQMGRKREGVSTVNLNHPLAANS